MTDRKLWRFFSDDEILNNWLESQHEFTTFVIEILNKVRKGELVTLDEKELDKKIKLARLEDYRLKAIKGKTEIRIDLIRLGIKPTEALDISEGRKELTDMGLVKVTNEGVEIPQETKLQEWTHFCKSTGRDVTFREEIVECKYCGIRKT